MAARIGIRQKQMLVWLLRHEPRAYVGFATPATDEISGWVYGEATAVIRSLRSRGLVHCLPSGAGYIELTTKGSAIAAEVKAEVQAKRDAFERAQEEFHGQG